MAGIYLALHMAGNVLDALDIGDGRPAELHDQPRHVVVASRAKKGALS
jgi:hypothetical protein